MNIKEILDKYLEENGRIGVKLSVLLYNLRSRENPMKLLDNLWKPGQDILKLFKIMILIHQCFYQEVLPIEQTIDLLGSLINKAAQGFKNKPNKFEEHLFHQGVQPYALYLQKKLQNENQPQLDKESQLYRDLNLLKRGVSFAQILYIFGRYFSKSHQFFIDFNIIFAREANLLYHNFQARIARCKYMYDSVLRGQLQKIHEKMYIIYYNAYYHREVRDYVPQWLNTEQNKNHEQRYSHSARKSLKKKLSLQNNNIQSVSNCDPNGFMSSRKNIPQNAGNIRKLLVSPENNSLTTVTTERQTNLFSSGPLKEKKNYSSKGGNFYIYYDNEDIWSSNGKSFPDNPEHSFQNDFSVTLQRQRIDLMSSMQEVVSMIAEEQ